MYDLLDRGGKRWRPILILIISECFGRNIENLEENKGYKLDSLVY
jgi:geranylgeranyl pyrophosphate synthase